MFFFTQKSQNKRVCKIDCSKGTAVKEKPYKHGIRKPYWFCPGHFRNKERHKEEYGKEIYQCKEKIYVSVFIILHYNK